jgi:hypothetical protein
MKLLHTFLLLLLFVKIVAADADPIQTQLDSLQKQLDSLGAELAKIKQKEIESELDRLRKAARQQASEAGEAKKEELEMKTFKEGSRSLQFLNPEISVVGDMLTRYLVDSPHFTDEARTGFQFRVLELVFQSNVDPYTNAKAVLEFSPEEIGLAEAYITWTSLLSRLNITAGKFRQQFGVINRWHAHALDQVAFPLPIRLYMGEEGLNQTGFSVNWLMPPFLANANEFIFQLTNSSNENLFSGEEFSLPSFLGRFTNYYDLNPSTYLEFGLSGLVGTNDSLGFTLSQSHSWTYMAGLDLTLSWIPVNKSIYKGLLWRSEFFFLDKECLLSERIKAWGAYSYIDYRLNRRWTVGLRGDIAQPPIENNSDKYLWQIVPYVTFRQSEFVYLRLQYSRLEGKNMDTLDNRFILQINWAIGPHKHEKY